MGDDIVKVTGNPQPFGLHPGDRLGLYPIFQTSLAFLTDGVLPWDPLPPQQLLPREYRRNNQWPIRQHRYGFTMTL